MSTTLARPPGSRAVEITPFGLLSIRYRRSRGVVPARPRDCERFRSTISPSSSTRSLAGSTRQGSTVTRRPLTRTRPARIANSASRRENTPASASTFCSRSPPAGGGAAILRAGKRGSCIVWPAGRHGPKPAIIGNQAQAGTVGGIEGDAPVHQGSKGTFTLLRQAIHLEQGERPL